MGQNEDNKVQLALQLISNKRYAESESLLSELISSGCNLPDCFYGLGLIRLSSGQLGPARDYFQKCVQLNPSHANGYYYLGYISELLKEEDKARLFYARALEINPKHSGASEKLRPVIQTPRRHETSQEPNVPSVPQASSMHSAAQPVPPYSLTQQPGANDSDFYGLLRQSSEPVEQEISRHLDAIASLIGTRRPRVRGLMDFRPIIVFLLISVVATIGIRAAYHTPRERNSLPSLPILIFFIFCTIFVAWTLSLWLKATNSRITCERDWLLRSQGVLRKSTVNYHLYLKSRGGVGYDQTLLNRMTDDGSLNLEYLPLRGYFRRSELEGLAGHFRQLSVLNPTSRNILAALGELKQIRSGAN